MVSEEWRYYFVLLIYFTQFYHWNVMVNWSFPCVLAMWKMNFPFFWLVCLVVFLVALRLLVENEISFLLVGFFGCFLVAFLVHRLWILVAMVPVDMSGGTGCVCGVPILSMTYQVCCCDHRSYQSHSDNANEHMLTMLCVSLLIVLLVVYQYMSVSYIVLPENGLTSILSNKYHRGGAPWGRALSG